MSVIAPPSSSCIENDEFNALCAVYRVRAWIERMRAAHPNINVYEAHVLLSRNHAMQMSCASLGWGDAFMTDQMFFSGGGKYKLADYPDAINPYVGMDVVINGEPCVITQLGLLTFDARVVQPDSSDADSDNSDN